MSPVKRKSSAQFEPESGARFCGARRPHAAEARGRTLSGGALSSSQLTANTYISRQAVTKHLQVLSDAGVTRDMKAGRERLWQLDPARIEDAKRSLEVIGQQWEAALGKLKAFAEATCWQLEAGTAPGALGPRDEGQSLAARIAGSDLRQSNHNRQLTDPLARRREQRVAERRHAGGSAGSPRPVGELSLMRKCTSTGGASLMRNRPKVSKFSCTTLPPSMVMAW